MGLAGIPWWTTDIGGFHGGDPKDPDFRELLVRWFGVWNLLSSDAPARGPGAEAAAGGNHRGATCRSGAENEVWSFGKEAFEICKKYLNLREQMKPYITRLMKEAHEKGTPVMRPLFYDFPEDPRSWDQEDEYLFGPDVLVAPVMYAKTESREVYLPGGEAWVNFWTGESFEGGRTVTVPAPLDQIPLFVRNQIPWED